jgi:hypothetical protein
MDDRDVAIQAFEVLFEDFFYQFLWNPVKGTLMTSLTSPIDPLLI